MLTAICNADFNFLFTDVGAEQQKEAIMIVESSSTLFFGKKFRENQLSLNLPEAAVLTVTNMPFDISFVEKLHLP